MAGMYDDKGYGGSGCSSRHISTISLFWVRLLMLHCQGASLNDEG